MRHAGTQEADEALQAAAKTAREEGRTLLLESEGLALMTALGIRAPFGVVVDGAGDLPDTDTFLSDRVVVKILSPLVPHRTDVGGVRVVPKDSLALVRTLEDMAAHGPDPAARFLVQEHVEHDARPGGELLLGARWSQEFGTVVTLAVGGVATEALAVLTGGDALSRSWAAGSVVRDRVEAALEGPWGELVLGTLRGRKARVSADVLADAVGAFADAAARWMPDAVVEMEINPLVFQDGEPMALDALVRLAPPAHGRSAHGPASARRELVRTFLYPRSLAVVGASARDLNPGRVILRNTLAAGMPASRVQVVKQGMAELDGCRCVPNVASLEPVDVLALSVGAVQLPELLHEVVEDGKARGVIATSSGVGEGERGSAVADAVAEVLELPGAPMINGANCLGIRSVPGRFDSLFIPPEKLGFPDVPPHPVALLSQSGAFAIARVSPLPWLNPRFVVTVGNQTDVTLGEWLEALVDEPGLDVVACYVEGFRDGDGRRFLDAAAAHKAKGRQVLLYRGGRTPEGQRATASHTASLAGDWLLTRGLASDAGCLVAESAQDFTDLLALAVRLHGRRVEGASVGLLSNAGFECVAMADGLGALRPAPLEPETVQALGRLLAEARLGGLVAAANPLDLTPTMGDEGFAEAARLLLADATVDVGVVSCVPLTPALQTLPADVGAPEDVEGEESLAARLGALWDATDKAWVAAVDAGPRYDRFRGLLEARGIPVVGHADRAVRALGAYVAARVGAT
ncbi:MAG: hypothetical protein AMXMBFR53_15830 [Gemmatimonadota bacterium]